MEKGWIKITEDDTECITLVHESDCKHQVFDNKRGEYVCSRCSELCNENCPLYSGLHMFLEEYEDIPEERVEVCTNLRIVSRRDLEKDPYGGLTNEDLLSDDDLLYYLQTEVWNQSE